MASTSSVYARNTSATDHACAGVPRGVCGAAESAISEIEPNPASRKCAAKGVMNFHASARATVVAPCVFTQPVMNGPTSHGHTVPW